MNLTITEKALNYIEKNKVEFLRIEMEKRESGNG
jgi:hypothetical protein